MKTLLTAALGILLTATAPSAQTAAPADGPAADEWARRVSVHLTANLGSPSPDVRARALHTAVSLAQAYPGHVDLRPAVPTLLDLYGSDPDARVRLLALTALHASGDEEAMRALRAAVGQQGSDREERALLAALADHYGVETFAGDAAAAAVAARLRTPLVAVDR